MPRRRPEDRGRNHRDERAELGKGYTAKEPGRSSAVGASPMRRWTRSGAHGQCGQGEGARNDSGAEARPDHNPHSHPTAPAPRLRAWWGRVRAMYSPGNCSILWVAVHWCSSGVSVLDN